MDLPLSFALSGPKTQARRPLPGLLKKNAKNLFPVIFLPPRSSSIFSARQILSLNIRMLSPLPGLEIRICRIQ